MHQILFPLALSLALAFDVGVGEVCGIGGSKVKSDFIRLAGFYSWGDSVASRFFAIGFLVRFLDPRAF